MHEKLTMADLSYYFHQNIKKLAVYNTYVELKSANNIRHK